MSLLSKKGGLQETIVSLVIHAIVLVACLSVIYFLVTSLIAPGGDVQAKHELEHLVKIIDSFDEGDRQTLLTTVFLSDKYVITSGKMTVKALGTRESTSQGRSVLTPLATPEQTVLTTSCKQCLCLYNLETGKKLSQMHRVECEDLSGNLQRVDSFNERTFAISQYEVELINEVDGRAPAFFAQPSVDINMNSAGFVVFLEKSEGAILVDIAALPDSAFYETDIWQ